MTREEAHRILSNGLDNAPSEHEWCMAFEMAIKALSQEPTRDIEKSNFSQEQYLLDTDTAYKIGYEQGKSEAQKSGKWIAVYQGDEIINYRCSECELGDTNGSTNLYGWDYCRRCGAKMESGEE